MDTSDDAADILALETAIPVLYRARAFADALPQCQFFRRVGERLNTAEAALARRYLDGLGFIDADPALALSWEDAAAAAMALDADPAGWEAEELARATLTDSALHVLDEEALSAGLTLVAEKAGAAAREALEEAGALWDVEDEGLLNAAAGAAVQAAHGAALALLAAPLEDDAAAAIEHHGAHDGDDEEIRGADEDDTHPFLLRFRLFARGRWPIGLAGRTYNIL